MVGQSRLYAAATAVACLGVLALSVAAAWSQVPAPSGGGTAVPPVELPGGSGGTSAAPDPPTVPIAHPARLTPVAAQAAPAQQTPEKKQEREREVPLEHLKPTTPQAAPQPTPQPPTAPRSAPLPTLTPVTTLRAALPNTGAEPWTLALTGLALLSLGASLRSAAMLRSA